jgi:tRNA pseudouridine38-40 synthase
VKLALLVAYDGTDFRGLARQPGLDTVQGTIEERLARVLRAPDVTTVAAGRTDAGVHAEGQVLSFDAPRPIDPAWLVQRLNAFRDARVVVRGAALVADDFDARFSATRRAYRYRVYVSEHPDPFRDRFAWQVRSRLALAPMRAAAKHLVGEHDFSTFCRRGTGAMMRRIRRIDVTGSRAGARTATYGDEVTIEPVADSFCQQQVRAITGWLVACGSGDRDPADTSDVLAARDRHAAAPIAPARGLMLVSVTYPHDPFAGEEGS